MMQRTKEQDETEEEMEKIDGRLATMKSMRNMVKCLLMRLHTRTSRRRAKQSTTNQLIGTGGEALGAAALV
ncbi:hypothetical protein ACHAW6_003840 [Cyclotella cf. meneghiniana]